MENKGLIVFSSKTGNTKKVAEAVHSSLKENFDILPIDSIDEPIEAENLIIGFWVDKGTVDSKTEPLLKELRGKKIAYLGTLGAYPDSPHAKDVEAAVQALTDESNEYLGCFLCQGKIDPKLTAMFAKFPSDHPHSMDEARKKRHEEAAKHPNEEDFANARAFFKGRFI